MTIECYRWACQYHSHNDRQGEGPFCFREECMHTGEEASTEEARLLGIISMLEHELKHFKAFCNSAVNNHEDSMEKIYDTFDVRGWAEQQRTKAKREIP